jgi:hypothetical protein
MAYFAFGSLPSPDLAAMGTERQNWHLLDGGGFSQAAVASFCQRAALLSSPRWELWEKTAGKQCNQFELASLTSFFTSCFSFGFLSPFFISIFNQFVELTVKSN